MSTQEKRGPLPQHFLFRTSARLWFVVPAMNTYHAIQLKTSSPALLGDGGRSEVFCGSFAH